MTATFRSILITGGTGYLGTEVVARLAWQKERYRIIVFDVRKLPAEEQLPGVQYVVGDVRDESLGRAVEHHQVDTVIHLASIVNPGGPKRRAFEYSVDVGGTENVLKSCVQSQVKQLIVTSSGAAYGYHADNPAWLSESDPLRGNPEFAYADHKRLIEELLARYRQEHPELKQLVFRPGTVLGKGTDNSITKLFRGKRILGIRGYETPFVFIWDQDVAECIVRGLEQRAEGIYNLAGDGVLSLREIAGLTSKPYVQLPLVVFKTALWLLQKLGITPHGPEQTLFLQYRPVLANEKLKQEFGYIPRKTTKETFLYYWNEGNSPA